MNLISIALGILLLSNPLKEAVEIPDDCKVLIETISGTYEGGCKKGLANGNGKSVGENTYEGEFKKGLPHGDGTYTWANGDVYKGAFKKGLKHGEGLMTFAAGDKPPIKGFWVEEEYIGTDKTPYKVINKTNSVTKASFRRTGAEPNEITFKFTRLGKPVKCGGLSILGSFGVITKETEYTRIIKVHNFPMQGAVNFSAMQQRDAGGGAGGDYESGNLEFSINQAGSWEITIEIQQD